MSNIRVRFAPSPTGFVHIGGLRTALYNYLFAKKHGGTFCLRIEDTDRTRFVEGATENLINMLDWAGLNHDEGPNSGGDFGPYFQSERTDIYKEYAQQLIDNGFAYYAFDTSEELDALRSEAEKAGSGFRYNYETRSKLRNSLNMAENEWKAELDNGTPHVVRMIVPENRDIQFEDIVRGTVTFNTSQVDDQILIKSDGFPTYHLANVVDDHLMEISHVIRGEEWLSSVPKHLLLYEFLGWDAPVMAHLPLIFNPDKSKMSKRDIQSLSDMPTGKVDPDVASYVNAGYEKSALVNYIALLGWNPGEGDEQEVFTEAELIEKFSLERVNKAGAVFDLQKLNWLNAQHVMKRATADLVQQIVPMLKEAGIDYKSDEYLTKVMELMKPRLQFAKDFVEGAIYFFTEPTSFDEKGIKKRWKERSLDLMNQFADEIEKLDELNDESIDKTINDVAQRNELGNGQIIHPTRLAVSGVSGGPSLYHMLIVLGKETVVERLRKNSPVINSIKSEL